MPIWDGTYWVLDLLPNYPEKCLNVLDAYLSIYADLLPDGRLSGLCDAMDLIRLRYIEKDFCSDVPDIFAQISSRQLEQLTASLYQSMDYDVELTPSTKDGGKDVIAKRRKVGQLETVFIEVKHHKKPIGVDKIRQLFGIVADKKVNKGILVSVSNFTRGAITFASSNPRLELLDISAYSNLLGKQFGRKWFRKIYHLIGLYKDKS